MDPAVPKATLKVLGLCVALLVLVAAVTVSVAVLLWRSEALGMLRGCRERAANESRVLELRLAELEQDRARLQRAAAESARAEDARRRELAQAREEGEKLNSSLASCRERAVGAVGMGTGGGFPAPQTPLWGCMHVGRATLPRKVGEVAPGAAQWPRPCRCSVSGGIGGRLVENPSSSWGVESPPPVPRAWLGGGRIFLAAPKPRHSTRIINPSQSSRGGWRPVRSCLSSSLLSSPLRYF